MVALEDIQRIADRIAERFDPERIILFGSQARGTAREHSDVDLLIVMTFEGKPFWKSMEIWDAVRPDFSTDLLARRPDDTARRYREGDPLIRDALDYGRVLYERNR